MAITLSKGQKVSLTKGNPGLKHIVVGLGWDTNKYDGGFDFDLDSAAFLLDENGKVNADTDFVFYNNLKHSSGAVEHLGDNLTGEGDGDDEQVKVDLSLVPLFPTINKLTSRSKSSPPSNILVSHPNPNLICLRPGFPLVKSIFCPFFNRNCNSCLRNI